MSRIEDRGPTRNLSLRRFLPILLIVILPLTAGCSSTRKSQVGREDTGAAIQPSPKAVPEVSYPAWFWDMPISEGVLFAVGLSRTFAHADTSEEYANKDGVENLSKALSVRVRGGRGMRRERGKVIPSGSDMQEEVSPAIHSFVKEHYHVVAKHVLPEYTFVLLSLGQKDAEIPVPSAVSPVLPEKPDWITALPEEPGYVYASGESSLYYRETESWSLAEERARAALALNLESRVRGLKKKEKQETQILTDSTVIDVRTDVQLSRVQIVSRWKHPEFQTCHVLVRMPFPVDTAATKGFVRSIQSGKPEEKSQTEIPQKSREEIIREVFDELDRLTDPENQDPTD